MRSCGREKFFVLGVVHRQGRLGSQPLPGMCLCGKVDYVVSGDRHLLGPAPYEDIAIITVGRFSRIGGDRTVNTELVTAIIHDKNTRRAYCGRQTATWSKRIK